MKQKFFSILIIFTCLFGFIASANAENYVGTLSNVMMNGKHFNDVANTVFSLTARRVITFCYRNLCGMGHFSNVSSFCDF